MNEERVISKLNTSGYNSDLDELMDNKVDVYLKAKLTKRLTYGEYVGEPNNGFELLIGDEQKTLNLDNVDVFTCKDKPSLTDDQQVVLDYLIKQAERCSDIGYLVGDLNFFASTEDGKAWDGLTEKERYQVLAAFAEWGMEQEEE